MKTALDSSVLLTILNDEPGARAWLDLLVKARTVGRLIICPVVYSELAPAFRTEKELAAMLGKLGVHLENIGPYALWAAGQAFLAYRRAGGPRTHLIPDFMIAAHAQHQADRLASNDRGFFRRYFPNLVFHRPTDSGGEK